MSKVSIQGDQNGTGVFTLEAPNSNVDRTLNLPDEAGTLATVENLPAGYTDSDALDLFNATGSAPVYACRAWVNYDAKNSIIRASGNVSSITDDGTGFHFVNFTVSMPDANYNVHGTSGGIGGDDGDDSTVTADLNFGSTSQSPRLRVRNHLDANTTDVEHLYVAFIR